MLENIYQLLDSRGFKQRRCGKLLTESGMDFRADGYSSEKTVIYQAAVLYDGVHEVKVVVLGRDAGSTDD